MLNLGEFFGTRRTREASSPWFGKTLLILSSAPLGLGEIGPEAKKSKYSLAHLDFNGKLHPEADLFSSLF